MRTKIKTIISQLKKGKIGVMPTDTLYGLVGSAFSKKAVAAIYKIRKRNLKKPLIVLISSKSELKKFGILSNSEIKQVMQKFWPGKVSIIIPCPHKKYTYLHRGRMSIAFRLPKTAWLRRLLLKTGPLVAPSANPEGKIPAYTVEEARAYFGNSIDFYLDRGKSGSRASKVIQITNTGYSVIRAK